MDISAVNPEHLVRAALQDREINAQLEAQAGLLKDAQEGQANAVMALLGAIPEPQPDGSLGHNLDVYA